jgi:DNA polymerase-3 subunit alpha
MTTGNQKFINLHNHSHYSLLDGLSKIDDMIALAKERGMPALGLTDHGNMYGAIEFYKKCKKAGINPIIGVEAYVIAGSRHDNARVSTTSVSPTLAKTIRLQNLMHPVTLQTSIYYQATYGQEIFANTVRVSWSSGCFGENFRVLSYRESRRS